LPALLYDTSQATLPSRKDLDRIDFVVMNDPVRVSYIADVNELVTVRHNDALVVDLIAFMHALTDPASIDLRGDVPDYLPSGLPLAD
jgi:cytochrome c peroxidase